MRSQLAVTTAVVLTAAIASLGASESAWAVELEPLSASELQRRCRAFADSPEAVEGRACVAYIRGFLDASSSIRRESAIETQAETFTDRALRTRLGLPREPRPLYCLTNFVSPAQLAAELLSHLEEHPPDKDTTASMALYAILGRHHRCNV